MIRRKKDSKRAGFTLIELLLVVVIIGILAAIVVPRLVGRSVEAQIAAAREQIRIFATSLDMYHMDNGFYPSTEQGLQSLIVQPTGEPEPKKWKQYLNAASLPLDPWGHEYLYMAMDTNNFDIKSMGPDGKDGTEDDILKP
jgi:general secretion pathway protein G